MKKLLLALFAGLALSVASAAPVTPYIDIAFGDGSVRIGPDSNSVEVTKQGDVETWRFGAFEAGGLSFSSLVFAFDPDPFIAFSVNLVKNTATSTSYVISFGAPYIGGPYDTVSSQLAASLDGVQSAQLTAISHTTTVDATNVLVTAMPDCSSSGALVTCTPTSGGSSITPTGPSGFFISSFGFTLDAPSNAIFNGRSDLFAAPTTRVPNPATLPLALLALAGLGWVQQRRRPGLHG